MMNILGIGNENGNMCPIHQENRWISGKFWVYWEKRRLYVQSRRKRTGEKEIPARGKALGRKSPGRWEDTGWKERGWKITKKDFWNQFPEILFKTENRGNRIWTCDLSAPSRARYQTTPYSDFITSIRLCRWCISRADTILWQRKAFVKHFLKIEFLCLYFNGTCAII